MRVGSSGERSPAAAERVLFRAQQESQIKARLLWGAIAAALFCLTLAIIGPLSFPAVKRDLILAPAMVASFLLLATLASRLPGLRERPNEIVMVLGLGVAGCIGWAAAVTGGFTSPYFYILIVVWLFGSAVLPLAPLWFFADTAAELVLVLVLIRVYGHASSLVALPVLLTLTAMTFCVLGAALRDRTELRRFLIQLRLDRANQELAEHQLQLAQLNRDLERRVMEKVQERSRELALALQRLSERMPEDVAVLPPGTVIGDRVEIIRRLGAGGMGAVYLARDRVTDSQVAVKVLHPGGASDAASLRRFVAEAAAAATVNHPGVVRTLHVDVSTDGRLYHIMEHVEGITLDHALAQALFDSGACARVGAAVAEALAAAHQAAVIHRDIKPSNLILTHDQPGVRILDFGVSKLLSWHDELTGSHQAIGTPEFMAPEQVQNAAGVTGACDVYSLTLVLFRMLSGRSPFDNCAGTAYLVAHVASPPRDVSDLVPGVDAALAALIARGLAKSPETRPSAAELAVLLTAIADRLETPGTEAVLAPVLDRPTPTTVDAPLSSATVRGRMPRT